MTRKLRFWNVRPGNPTWPLSAAVCAPAQRAKPVSTTHTEPNLSIPPFAFTSAPTPFGIVGAVLGKQPTIWLVSVLMQVPIPAFASQSHIPPRHEFGLV